MITTYNFDDMQDIDWLKVVGKAVVVGFYNRDEDYLVVQFVGELKSTSINSEKTNVTISDRTGWYAHATAYALISFEESD